MEQEKSRVIKRILKDHFDGFWKMYSGVFPATYLEDIKATIEKAITCGTADLGYARYEC
ncbi:MAG: hypothetical protein Q8935_20750 [Bacillota bacterium]|nr:hypothetical protein [Bacillota bacterium]